MNTILIVDKGGTINETNVKNYDDNDLYKKCKFKNGENFTLRAAWKVKKYKFNIVEVWGKDKGRAGQENKYDFPPPIDKDLFFGSCAIVGKSIDNEIINISEEEWLKIYEKLFGGFENLNDTAVLDELEEDELENVPDHLKTKSGYLKDSFIVEDGEVEDVPSETESDSFDNTSELSIEDYTYSDNEF
tara:strand:+ start:65 stop:628 length:564 start_codon:yes stop_codon:yes gene_type:complete